MVPLCLSHSFHPNWALTSWQRQKKKINIQLLYRISLDACSWCYVQSHLQSTLIVKPAPKRQQKSLCILVCRERQKKSCNHCWVIAVNTKRSSESIPEGSNDAQCHSPWDSLSLSITHTHMRAHTHARMHARTHNTEMIFFVQCCMHIRRYCKNHRVNLTMILNLGYVFKKNPAIPLKVIETGQQGELVSEWLYSIYCPRNISHILLFYSHIKEATSRTGFMVGLLCDWQAAKMNDGIRPSQPKVKIHMHTGSPCAAYTPPPPGRFDWGVVTKW